MSPCKALLHRSLAQYRQLLDQLLALESDSGPEPIARVLDLQWQARQTDNALLPLLQAEKPESWDQSLHLRLELLEAVLAEQQRLLPVMLGRKAILAAELGQLRTGQSAMTGYRMGGDQRGSLFQRAG